jgi:hypothetical protein
MIEMNKLLSTERDHLWRLAGISKMDKVRNIKIRKILQILWNRKDYVGIGTSKI